MGIEQQNANEQHWKIFVLLLKEIAIEKIGNGWQTELANRTNFTQSNISRMFGLKYSMSLPNFIIIARALNVNFFFEDKDNQTDLPALFNIAMDKLGRRPENLPKN